MRKTLIACLLALCSGAAAQTETSVYRPGVTPEGAVYFLPKTVLRFVVRVEKTSYTPGDFCRYAQRYLRLNDVKAEPSVTHRLIGLSMTTFGEADKAKGYAVKFNAKTSACNIALADDGTPARRQRHAAQGGAARAVPCRAQARAGEPAPVPQRGSTRRRERGEDGRTHGAGHIRHTRQQELSQPRRGRLYAQGRRAAAHNAGQPRPPGPRLDAALHRHHRQGHRRVRAHRMPAARHGEAGALPSVAEAGPRRCRRPRGRALLHQRHRREEPAGSRARG